ncbi:MAG: helicase-exonuclease AddAB subunit AddA [Phycisphaerales bacterium]|nr:MAG: helicase-exonuclease AddAB subunit AddA [Phycisphaerales bacterium]
MAEKKIKWTAQQKRAIAARGSDVLVTASAGTGKTEVLSGRCVSILSDTSISADILNILLLTFTEAAAEQMRSRIAQRLKGALTESSDPHLRRQLTLLQGADISTIHAFCKRLITEYFYKLDIDPTFGVLDADEAALIKAEMLQKTIDWAWEQGNLAEGLEQLLQRRDLRANEGFLSSIIELSDFLDGVVSRRDWYARAVQLTETAEHLTSGLGEKQKQIVEKKLRDVLNQLRRAQRLYEGQGTGGKWAAALQVSHVGPIVRCSELLRKGDWDRCSDAVRDFSKPTTRTPKDVDEPIAGLLQKTAKAAVDAFKGLSQLAVVNPEYLDMLSGAVALQTRVLVELVKRFDMLYEQAKRMLNCVDFADLEHLALELLTDGGGSEDERAPSETALALRSRYKYIFVDEYQDINSVQEGIISALSGGDNVFVVGDVKQSIYAWRGAKPTILLDRIRHICPDSSDSASGVRVDLNANFRSAKAILDFVNTIFARVMTSSFAQIDYDDSAKLTAARADSSDGQTPQTKEAVVEFHILDETADELDLGNNETSKSAGEANPDVITARQRQAAVIARRIRQMVGAESGKAEFQVYDKEQDCLRDVQFRDIVVLMRSLAKKANDYVEILRLAGVPVSCEATAGYFEATEINDMLCLLKVLDNPQRDIELAAVLRSPFFNVTDTELAHLRIHDRTEPRAKNYYDCVLKHRDGGTEAELAAKLDGVLHRLDGWRTMARRGSLADLIWHIYRETGYLSFVSALSNGRARRANLLKLHDRAIQFEGFASSAGLPSLTHFVEFVERLREIGQDWAPAEPESAAGNAVRVLSVHKSKGLEFPVVFLAELESRFNIRDIHADVLADADGALGLRIVDGKSNSKLQSLAHQVIGEQKKSTALAEELRILYVATTRARDRLVLTASQKGNLCRQIITDGIFFADEPIPDWQIRSCKSPLEWILYGLSDQRSLHGAFETELTGRARDDHLFSFKLCGHDDLRQLSEFVLRLKSSKARKPAAARPARPERTGSKLLVRLKESLAWRYQFDEAPRLPAKSSVTRLTHRDDEYAEFDYSRALDRQPASLASAQPDSFRPTDARLIGTATHLVISQLDLDRPVTEAAIRTRVDKLVEDGAVTMGIAERIDAACILAFFESELSRVVLDSENTVWREWPFTFALPASEWKDSRLSAQMGYATADKIIIQGIIDMLVQTPRGLIVVDFKTDAVSADRISERAELYRRQLNLYGRAASAILQSPLIAKWLHFLAPVRSIEVR